MRQTKRMIALGLVLALCFGIAGCSAQTQSQSQLSRPGISQNRPTFPTLPQKEPASQETTAPTEPAEPVAVPEYTPLSSTMPTEAPQRDELLEIIDLVGGGSIEEDSVADLTEEELTDLIGGLLENSTAQNPGLENAPSASGNVSADKVTDEGPMEQPFDQLYPELMDRVEFSGESLTVKLSSGAELTGQLRDAGVAELELLFDLGESSWYEARLAAGTNATNVLSELRGLEDVIAADYNYSAHAHSLGQPQELPEAISGNEKASEQWYLKHFGITEGYGAMTNPGGSSTVVVAVIDTGVDTLHTDLAENIWVNQGEIPDNYMDDDGNGYADDVCGYNFVSSNGNVADDNGHGTHVAGIIAARNNYLGTVGLAYNVKIMPIKALNHEGVTNDIAIIDAVKYAMENGAEVINMSFGQEAMSLAVQEVLAAASSRCVLVASAGNSGAANEGEQALPNYPAALCAARHERRRKRQPVLLFQLRCHWLQRHRIRALRLRRGHSQHHSR